MSRHHTASGEALDLVKPVSQRFVPTGMWSVTDTLTGNTFVPETISELVLLLNSVVDWSSGQRDATPR